jgi:spore coat protein U-like protein
MFARKSVRIALITAITMLAAGQTGDALAGTATSNLPIQATVVSNCSLSTALLVQFGSYDPAVANNSSGVDLDTGAAPGQLTVQCTLGATNQISLGLGTHASVTQNRMLNGTTNFLNYNLYQDSAFSTPWTTTSTYSYVASGNADTVLVYGVVPKGQNVPLGVYNDSVVATITF